MSPHTEAKLGQQMLAAAIRDGQFPAGSNQWGESNDAICHIIEELDGGTMIKADAILLCGVGDARLYSRSVERGMSLGVFEQWDRAGVACISATCYADEWLLENGQQGRLI